MIALGPNHQSYLPSSVLSQRIRVYNERLVELLPFLREQTNLKEINTELPMETSFKEMCLAVEPTILAVRSSGTEIANNEKANIMTILSDSQKHQFIELNVSDLV
jgi:hypothetical protein